MTILAGDVFACTANEVGEVNALYDRAALIALPPEVRPRYVAHLRSLLSPGSMGLLVTLEYDATQLTPPPYSVTEREVRDLYRGARVLNVDARPATGERFKHEGVEATQRCFALELGGAAAS